ncbi:MAG TPA: hypothetical protein PKC98_25680, partial [Candidatus Melainabacteria bacterium]|nr:hypothetical protein [Candidatus Melainabacteria bacterium]
SDQDRLNAVTVESVASISLEQAQQELSQAESSVEQARAELETEAEAQSFAGRLERRRYQGGTPCGIPGGRAIEVSRQSVERLQNQGSF